MMKTRTALLLLMLLGAAAFIFARVQGAPLAALQDFTLERADYRANLTIMKGPSDILVDPRFVLQYANQTVTYPLSPPAEGLLIPIDPRFVLEFANQTVTYSIIPVPDALMRLVQEAGDRFVLEFANQTVTVPLVYPGLLVGDTTPPALSPLKLSMPTRSTLRIATTTSEWSMVTLEYGTTSGSYPYAAVDRQFTESQANTIPGVTPDQPVYFRFMLTDRAGNVAVTDEYEFTLNESFVPQVRK